MRCPKCKSELQFLEENIDYSEKWYNCTTCDHEYSLTNDIFVGYKFDSRGRREHTINYLRDKTKVY